MNHTLRLAAFLAPLLVCAGCTSQAAPTSASVADVVATPIHLEAEDAQLTGAQFQNKRDGFLGAGYVSGLTKEGDNIKWTVNAAAAGIYEARLRYSAPFGKKDTELVVNGAKTSATLPETKEVFETASLGKIELKAGENSVVINKGWGYYDVDALDFVPVGVASNAATSATSADADGKLHLEAEDAELTGTKVETKREGFSGKGYVSGFLQDGDNIKWNLPVAKAGIYEARLRYSSPFGEKGIEIVINGVKTSAKLPETKDVFATTSLGKVELKAGDNQIVINKGWGYYDIDALDFVSSDGVAAVAKPPATLSDAKATPAARALMKYLVSQYGEKTLSGQYEDADNKIIAEKFGVMPAVFGGDLMRYSPSFIEHGSTPEGASEAYIKRAQNGQILTLSWHWNAPSHLIDKNYLDKDGKEVQALWWSGFYTRATTFDLEATLADPNGENYKLMLRDIDVIAGELKKFADADVPVLWRPLHETEGGWFWWGAKGPDAYKKLWRLMVDRLTVKHDLHNLIWVYTTEGKDGWYPGDDVVDMVGADAYPTDYTDPLTGIWGKLESQYGGRKLIALSEVGKVPDFAKMDRLGVRWSYFTSWSGGHGPTQMTADALKINYTAPIVANLREVVALQAAATPAVAVAAPMLADAVKPYFPPTRIEYNAVAQQTRDNLQTQVLAKWFPAAVNREQGGFDQNFGYDWTKLPGSERSIVYQSRLTWTAAQAAMRLPAEEFIYRNYARHGVEELGKKMWDAKNGGFYWQVDKGVADRNGEKHVYGNAFAIYALSAAYKATKNPDALRLAQQDFFWLEKHAHDDKNKGYFEALNRDGSPILAPVSPDQKSDFIGTRYGYKSMNTHIHLLEAYGALYEVWPEPQLKTRLNELFELVRDKIYVEPGALNQYFTLDWRPVPAEDSYGHDIETAYLLTEAAHILGRGSDPKARRAARMLVDHTLDVAFDQERGGIANDGGVWGNIHTHLTRSGYGRGCETHLERGNWMNRLTLVLIVVTFIFEKPPFHA